MTGGGKLLRRGCGEPPESLSGSVSDVDFSGSGGGVSTTAGLGGKGTGELRTVVAVVVGSGVLRSLLTG